MLKSGRHTQSSSWLSWYRSVLDVADRLPVVVRFPAGPRVRLKTVDPPKGNGLGKKKRSPGDIHNPTRKVAALAVQEAKRGSPKQTTHQETKTKLSSATPNRDKTIHCQRKHRKKHLASNVAAESAPHPRHVVKACDNKTQTIPNNIVLWQRLATCRRLEN